MRYLRNLAYSTIFPLEPELITDTRSFVSNEGDVYHPWKVSPSELCGAYSVIVPDSYVYVDGLRGLFLAALSITYVIV